MGIKLLKIALLLVFISVKNIFSQDQKFHVVEKGETLYSISKKYEVSIEKIKELNNITNNSISIGQKIFIEEIVNKSEIQNEELVTSRVEGFASSIDQIEESDKYLALHK